ncbi:alpha/beta fold hydrolase [Aldersonia kunmingensis]|uniref:alpha/beta fold hydrolase n=1 Tax=Aldersonia kunmingensis TaxID=408066 RepID=UPI00082F2C46|nr:alpha/beta hydrolase [Aldersonia kunmingensis]
MIAERFVDTNGVRLQVTEAGPRGGPVVVLAHGFPELAHSWRHQIPVLAEAGYHVLAPNQRGYGESSRPEAVEDYDIAALCGDLVGLLDDVGAERAVFVGHDWGSVVTWHVPLAYPERVAGVVGVSTPPVPRPPAPPTQIWRRRVGESFFYILYFQEPGIADTDLSRDTRTTMRRMLGGRTPLDADAAARVAAPGPQGYVERLPDVEALPDWLSEDELAHYVEVFAQTGFTGPLNWYRNFDRNWMVVADFPASTVTAPSLFIAGADDPVLAFTPRNRVHDLVSGDYREVLIEGAGHWIQQERSGEVNEALLSFLAGLDLE